MNFHEARAPAPENRVIRGGSFNNPARNARSAARNRNHASNDWNNVGFRPASPLESARSAEIELLCASAAAQRAARTGFAGGACSLRNRMDSLKLVGALCSSV